MRRFGTPPRPGTRYGRRAGVYGIVVADDAILATFQEAPTPELQLPGGGIDDGESALAALHREVMEETGYRIGDPVRLGAFRRFTYMPDYRRYAEKVCQIYLATLGPRHGPPSEPGHAAVFLPWPVAARRLAVSGDRHFVQQAGRRLGVL